MEAGKFKIQKLKFKIAAPTAKVQNLMADPAFKIYHLKFKNSSKKKTPPFNKRRIFNDLNEGIIFPLLPYSARLP
jgi:hypothetical protein